MAMEKRLELLSPAGDWERLEMALAYGADAVYLAGDTSIKVLQTDMAEKLQ